MRLTSIALAHLVLIGFSLGVRAGEPPLTPIIIEIIKDRPDHPVINHREFTIPEAVHWLKETSEKFGRADPVVIKMQPGGEIDSGVLLLKWARHWYDNVYLGVPRNDGSGLTLLSASRDEIAVQLEKQLPGIRPATSLTIGDGPDPNKIGTQQLNRLQKIQNGELSGH
ncbi:MAG: hypothetical protein ACOYM3_06485 [Terrimicrobiaceae bacterium]